MKATEFRIGNWFYSNCKGRNEWVEKHHFSASYIDGKDSYYLENCAEPIPLTKEWLERFGFVYNDNCSRFDSNMWNVRNRPEGKEISMNVWKAVGKKDDGFWGVTLREEITFDDVTPVAIQYVHQLQNLYFALTGEELEPKP